MNDGGGTVSANPNAPARHTSTSTTMTVSSEAGPSTPTLTHRTDVHPPAIVRDSSSTPSPVSQTSGEERFIRGPPTPGVRLSRMMMGKMGTLPPPPGPPPLGPPPLPPASTHPFAHQPHIPSPGHRSSSLPSAAAPGAQSRMSILHNPLRPPPPAPPPTSALPPIPSGSSTGTSGHRRQISIASSTSSGGSGHGPRRRTTKGKTPSLDGPPSPAMSSSVSGHGHADGPPISPRTSSLLSTAQASSSKVQGSRESSIAPSSPTHPHPARGQALPVPAPTVPDAKRQPRTPSRHLLQSALDLAQRAVEMDRNNDVEGSLAAYREAVARLRSVMERVGVESSGDGKRRTASGKSEEEGRTLRGIHDAYVARIELLSSYATVNGGLAAVAEPDQTLQSRHEPEGLHTKGDVTPTRSSLDETAHVGIGNLMLSDPTSSFTTPDRGQAGPSTPSRTPSSPTPASRQQPSPIPKGLNINVPIGEAEEEGNSVSLQQALDHAADSARSSPAGPSKRTQSRIGLGHPSTSPRTVVDDSADLTPSKRREMLRAKMAAGNIEFLESTVDDDSLPTSASSPGHSSQGSGASNLHTIIRPPPSEAGSRRSEDKGLPPLPPSAPSWGTSGLPVFSGGTDAPGSLMYPRSDGLLVSPTTTSGRIAQRRLSRQAAQTSISSMTEIGSGSAMFPSSSEASTNSTLSPPQLQQTPTGRARAKSQPGTRPDLFHHAANEHHALPPLPSIPHKTSAHFPKRIASDYTNGLAPPHATGVNAQASSPHSLTRSISSSLISPVPEPQPIELIHRPFHLLRLLQSSMDPQGSGAYLTGSIHISPHIWQTSIHTRPGQRKDAMRLVAQDVKVRCMEALIINLEIVRATGIPLLDGPRELKYGAPLTHVPPPRGGEGVVKMAEEFSHALDGLEDEMDQTYKLMIKAGVQVNGWKGKKSGSNAKSWGSRFTRSMDKITHTKALDSSDKYVELLSHFCATVQAIDDHLLNFTGPCTPAYHYLPPRARAAIESRILKAAEFTSAVVVPFILDDFRQFFSRYLRGGVRYLED